MITFGKDTSFRWTENKDVNYMFIKSVEDHANALLRTKGVVMEHEIEDLLGIPKDFIEYNPDESFMIPSTIFAYIATTGNPVEFECFSKSNGDILIHLLGIKEYPIRKKLEL